jgi:hypothetical protein
MAESHCFSSLRGHGLFNPLSDPFCLWGRLNLIYRGADKSLARPGGKKAIATEEFDFHISFL